MQKIAATVTRAEIAATDWVKSAAVLEDSFSPYLQEAIRRRAAISPTQLFREGFYGGWIYFRVINSETIYLHVAD